MRRAGVLAAVFSLPGRYGIGDFGNEAYRFVEMIAAAGASVWQVLPLNPVGFGNSPYQSDSSFAGEPLYIDPDALYRDGLLSERPAAFQETSGRVDYDAVRKYKMKIFREAFQAFQKDAAYEAFLKEESWVREYAEFRVLLDRNGGKDWYLWPEEASGSNIAESAEGKAEVGNAEGAAKAGNAVDKSECKSPAADKKFSPEEQKEADFHCFLQYEFRRQWQRLRAFANAKGIRILGDIPFYAGPNSLDTYAHREEFLLDERGKPYLVAGVPPDYFSADGQRWGNPVYNWQVMEEKGFSYWNERMKALSGLYDMIRVDHFRAFDSYWVIPAEEPTAIRGEWRYAPGYAFFDQLLPRLSGTEIVAEDLGLMREEVYQLRDHYHFPGMKVLQFTYFDPWFRTRENMICYTGTHDNDTAIGWYHSLTKGQQKALKKTLKFRNREAGFAAALMKKALEDPAETVILPVQDILGLGTEARINTPGIVSEKNWNWKMTTLLPLREKLQKFSTMIEKSGRSRQDKSEEETK